MAVETLFPYGSTNIVDILGPSEAHSVKMQMQGGGLCRSSSSGPVGYPYIANDGDGLFFDKCHTVLMLSLELCVVTDVDVEQDETLFIHHYNKNGVYQGYVASVDAIPSGTGFVKFELKKNSAYTYLRTLNVTVLGLATLVKNSTPSLVTKHKFSFETTYPSYFDTTGNNCYTNANVYIDSDFSVALEDSARTYIGNNAETRYYDNGYVELPPNYTNNGTPVPLVVFIHGTGGWATSAGFSGEPNTNYDSLKDFIVNNGYALCDCVGITNANKTLKDQDGTNAFAAPSFASCIKDMVKYLCANYNICDDGVYIYGKSSGGYVLHLLTQQQGLKIRAAASLAPAISVLANIAYSIKTNYSSAEMMCEQLGITGLKSSWSNNSALGVTRSGSEEDEIFNDFVEFISNNIHKFRQVDPFFYGCDLSDEQVANVVVSAFNDSGAVFPVKSTTNTNPTKREYYKSQSAMSILNYSRIHVNVPTKIWIASNDTSVSYISAKLFVELAQRTGSPVYLRRMPSFIQNSSYSGTRTSAGGHTSVDTNANAPKVLYKPKYSDTAVNIPIAYAELVDWFNRY